MAWTGMAVMAVKVRTGLEGTEGLGSLGMVRSGKARFDWARQLWFGRICRHLLQLAMV